ncbi:MAG: imidazoleglycerol-phosphate dehydratase HisB [Oscillospiraceae bacterium]|nr:imidazoleglycerol-phosphate dehydratase HisB [Oscillospiraceae bacterium]
MSRAAQIQRNTKETQITACIDLDCGEVNIKTGIGFFDHMLTAFAVHSGIGLNIQVQGDLDVDGHHTVEDTGIVLGKVIQKALENMGDVERYGFFIVPMDESYAKAVLDLSGRPFLKFKAKWANERMGEYDTCLTEEFFRALCANAGMTLHLTTNKVGNDHHRTEAMFKAFAHAFRQAIRPRAGVLSTKGVL